MERFSMAATLTPISERERANRAEALVAAIANLRIEDLHVDDELKRMFQRHVDGEIGDEELGAAIDELNERRLGPLPRSRNGRP
jgi:antitoxin VbhA-like protein